MSLDTVGNLVRVVLDTNILISAIAFGGKPAQILIDILRGTILGITSPILLAELQEVLTKKFPLSKEDIDLFLQELKESFIVVQPKEIINTVRDADDNRVLEAAIEGNCDYIVTGDKDLLVLKNYKKVEIVTAEEFLSRLKQ